MKVGKLIINVYANDISLPISDALVLVNGDGYHKHYQTDISGKIYIDDLPAPDKEYSMYPQTEVKPYSTYKVSVTKPGFVPVTINNSWKLTRWNYCPLGIGNSIELTIHNPFPVKDMPFPEIFERTKTDILKTIH